MALAETVGLSGHTLNNGRQGDISIKATVLTVENLAQGVKEVIERHIKILTEGINVQK